MQALPVEQQEADDLPEGESVTDRQARRRAAYTRYRKTAAGRESQRRYNRSWKRKIVAARWAAKNPDKVHGYRVAENAARRAARQADSIRICAALLCAGTFQSGHGRRFCDDCRIAFGYATHETRPERATYHREWMRVFRARVAA